MRTTLLQSSLLCHSKAHSARFSCFRLPSAFHAMYASASTFSHHKHIRHHNSRTRRYLSPVQLSPPANFYSDGTLPCNFFWSKFLLVKGWTCVYTKSRPAKPKSLKPKFSHACANVGTRYPQNMMRYDAYQGTPNVQGYAGAAGGATSPNAANSA